MIKLEATPQFKMQSYKILQKALFWNIYSLINWFITLIGESLLCGKKSVKAKKKIIGSCGIFGISLDFIPTLVASFRSGAVKSAKWLKGGTGMNLKWTSIIFKLLIKTLVRCDIILIVSHFQYWFKRDTFKHCTCNAWCAQELFYE